MDELMAVYLSEITKIETHVYHDTPDASVKRIKYFLETQTNHNVCYYLNDGITKFLGGWSVAGVPIRTGARRRAILIKRRLRDK